MTQKQRRYISASATDLPMKFIAPLGGTPFVDWNISNYVDLDPRSGSLRDYRGGEFSYDLTNYDHDGLDISPGNFRAMDDQGIPIFAAADGVVTFTREGEVDRNIGPLIEGGPKANIAIIDHGNGWETLYAHLRRDTVSVQDGQSVLAGDFLGWMGSSGNSTTAHLHFEVQYNNHIVATNLDRDTFYEDAFAYSGDSPGTRYSGTSSTAPTTSERKEGLPQMDEFAANQSVTFWNYNNRQNPGDLRRYTWFQPDGSVFVQAIFTQTNFARSSFNRHTITLPADPLLGLWEVRLEQNFVETSRANFTVSATGAPEIRVEEGESYSPMTDSIRCPINRLPQPLWTTKSPES